MFFSFSFVLGQEGLELTALHAPVAGERLPGASLPILTDKKAFSKEKNAAKKLTGDREVTGDGPG
ncbi:MAG: hypothetical protein IKQ96_07285 [Lachnospiraceae bacterium]|nr:hypothetical protein [Lachnospiraceae bacterium]